MGNLSSILHYKKDGIKRRHQANKGTKPAATALLIVDVQYDFIDGSLALINCPSHDQGEQVIPIINKLLSEIHFDVVVYTQDWHTDDHISFHDNLPLRKHLLAKDSKPFEELNVFDTAKFFFQPPNHSHEIVVNQILWPRHCVQGSHGAKLHKDLLILKSPKNCHVENLLKGDNSLIDSYSAFWDNEKLSKTRLDAVLKERNITHVFIVGIATDVCVYYTAVHSLENNYKTHIIEDACRGVDTNNISLRLDELKEKKCLLINSKDIKDFIEQK